jgi:hypothetical protein
MATVKVSALTEKTTASGTEELLINDAGVSKKITIDNLPGTTYTAGTNISISGTNVISSTDTDTTYSVGDGGLTQKNFTTTLKTKLDGVATSANNYTHPTTDGTKHVPTGGTTGQVLSTNGSGTYSWVDQSGGSSAGTFPFYVANGTSDTIAVTSGSFPFYKADGTQDNIGV